MGISSKRVPSAPLRPGHCPGTPLQDALVEAVRKHPGQLTRNGALAAVGVKMSGPRHETLTRMIEHGLLVLDDHPTRPKLFPGPATKRKR